MTDERFDARTCPAPATTGPRRFTIWHSLLFVFFHGPGSKLVSGGAMTGFAPQGLAPSSAVHWSSPRSVAAVAGVEALA